MESLDAIKAQIRGGEFREDAQAKDWVGYVFAEVLEVDASDPAEKKRIKKLIAGCLESGDLKIEIRREEKSRKEKKFVVAPDHPGATP